MINKEMIKDAESNILKELEEPEDHVLVEPGSIVDFSTWANIASRQGPVNDHGRVIANDIEAATFLKDLFSGFMTSPVGFVNGIPIQAKTATVGGTVEELIAFREKLRSQKETTDFYLYRVQFFPAMLIRTETDITTFETTVLEVPKFTPSCWKIRYSDITSDFYL